MSCIPKAARWGRGDWVGIGDRGWGVSGIGWGGVGWGGVGWGGVGSPALRRHWSHSLWTRLGLELGLERRPGLELGVRPRHMTIRQQQRRGRDEQDKGAEKDKEKNKNKDKDKDKDKNKDKDKDKEEVDSARAGDGICIRRASDLAGCSPLFLTFNFPSDEKKTKLTLATFPRIIMNIVVISLCCMRSSTTLTGVSPLPFRKAAGCPSGGSPSQPGHPSPPSARPLSPPPVPSSAGGSGLAEPNGTYNTWDRSYFKYTFRGLIVQGRYL